MAPLWARDELNVNRPDNFGQEGYVMQYRGNALLLTELILLAVTLLIICLRMFTRLYILGSVHSDDWWILLATATLIALTVVHCVGVKYGIGKHDWDIEKEESNIALTMGYIGQILYVAALGCVKISLLLFLQRIFPTKTMKRVVRGVLIFVLCFTVTCVFLFAFQCDTPEYYFTKVKGTAEANGGICLAPQVVYYPMAAVNILTDIVIWLLPVPMVLKARLSKKEKLGLLWVFILGGVAVGAAIVRPFNLRDIMSDGDPTWSMVNVSVWAMVETSVGVICASLPAIKPLIIRFAPRLLMSSGSNSRHDGTHGRETDLTKARRNSFALRSIKVTHEIHQKEDHANADPGEYANYGLQQPDVRRGFGEFPKQGMDAKGPNESNEQLVPPRSISSSSSEKDRADVQRPPAAHNPNIGP